jgi:transcriptional regulator with XRE-family HTH domain
MVDEAGSRLAHTLRGERQLRGWSQHELAERAGVSKAMISKVERGEASPTAAVLVRLSTAFELTLGTLFNKAEGASGRLVKHAQQPTWRDPESHYVRRQLFANATVPIELARVELPRRARVAMPASGYRSIRQVVWLLSGKLDIEDGGERYQLSRGDTYAFGAPSDAAFINAGNGPCIYLVAVSRR